MIVNTDNLGLIDYTDFTKVCIRAGTVVHVEQNVKAKIPAYILKINFGEYGIKTSSAQITEHYQPENLMGQQIIAVMNFPVKRIAGISSEVLVLACVSTEQGTILLQPSITVPNGTRVL